jgi:hypothetical protein
VSLERTRKSHKTNWGNERPWPLYTLYLYYVRHASESGWRGCAKVVCVLLSTKPEETGLQICHKEREMKINGFCVMLCKHVSAHTHTHTHTWKHTQCINKSPDIQCIRKVFSYSLILKCIILFPPLIKLHTISHNDNAKTGFNKISHLHTYSDPLLSPLLKHLWQRLQP